MNKLTAVFTTLIIALTFVIINTAIAQEQVKEFNLELQVKEAGDHLEDMAEKATGKEKIELLKLAAVYRVAWANLNLYRGYTDRAIELYKCALRLDSENTVAKLALKNLKP